MTKHIIRIVVSLLIVATLGYVGWSFFLKPNNNDYVYSEILSTLETISDKDTETNTITSKLTELETAGYYGTTGAQVAFSAANAQQVEIVNAREFLFGVNASNYQKFYGNLTINYAKTDFLVGNYAQASYSNYKDILEKALMNYVPFAQFAEGVTDADIDLFNQKAEATEKAYQNIVKQTSEILRYQASITSPTATTNEVLTGYYKGLLHSFTLYYASYADLVINLQNFVAEHTTESDFVYDISFIYYNSAVYSLKEYATLMNFNNISFADVSLTAQEIANNQYLLESLMYDVNYGEYELTFESNTAENFDLISNYNTLSKNYAEILFGATNVFARTNADKVLIINNDSNATASIRVAYVANVQELLTSIGFIAPAAEDPTPEEPTTPEEPSNPDGPEIVEF